MIGVHPSDAWGAGSGPLRRVHPGALMLAWFCTVLACLIVRPWHPPQLLGVTALTAAWLAAAGMPLKRLRHLLVFASVLFLPLFLFTPLLPGDGGVALQFGPLTIAQGAWEVPLAVVVRAAALLLVSAALVASLDELDARRALAALPLPRIVRVIVLEVLRWLGPLGAEAASISRAVSVRAGSSAGSGRWALIKGLPGRWLPRILRRADRAADAMAVRGYAGWLPERASQPVGARDAAVVLLAFAALAVAVAARGAS